jgi:hypothetical protein
MAYPLAKIPLQNLLVPLDRATAALARLDERVARSEVGQGWVERMHYLDACASLWIDGELVHLEDLVLHEAGADIRAPTHELTIARDVLRTRRRIAVQPPGWALGEDGLRSLRGQTAADGARAGAADAVPYNAPEIKSAAGATEPLADEMAALDALLARSEALLSGTTPAPYKTERERDPIVYDLDWNEDQRLEEWRSAVAETRDLPPALAALLMLDAWNAIEVLQHAAWLGRLLAAARLREAGLTTGVHLAALNLGLKTIPRDRRMHRDRTTRLVSNLQGIVAAADAGLREHDRLTLARTVMERRLVGRRQSSKLPELVALVLSRPIVSTGMVAKTLGITPRAALRIIEELNLRELTGRGRFRAWGIV